jgi:hypothetical protein
MDGSYIFALLLYIGKDCIFLQIIVKTFFSICSLLKKAGGRCSEHRNYSRAVPALVS